MSLGLNETIAAACIMKLHSLISSSKKGISFKSPSTQFICKNLLLKLLNLKTFLQILVD